MAKVRSRASATALRRLGQLTKEYRVLRSKAGQLRRAERALWRGLGAIAKPAKSPHLMTVAHRAGRPDRISHQPLKGAASLTAVARARGSSGLLCGCAPIIIRRQPNDDIDICVLIDCSNDPATSGFRCHYWCGTLEAPPVVGIARRTPRRRPARKR